MQLRYAFRLYPDAAQQASLARAFGCARVVFNDAVRAREDARTAGRPFPTAGQLSRKLITEAKQSKERSWLGEVSAVVLQQSLRDVEAAYRNFFASLTGTRKGPKLGAPRFKSRKDHRQSIRFTANARWSITGSGRLNLPKIGAVKVKWSRTLPTTPSSVTVIKDAAGRFFASFVIDTDPAVDAERMPETENTIGIDLGLTHFAVLSDGTKIDSPRFLRRAEKKLKKAQRELSRTLIKISRFEPTSQTCSTCGHRDGPKPLNVREWTCMACGTVHDRDTNAAINVKTAAGLAVSACGAPVGPEPVLAQREETGSHGFKTGNCAA